QFRDLSARVQDYMRDSTRLSIPVIVTTEGIQGLLINGSTIFPHAVAQGSCFNPDLVRQMAEACAREAAYTGVSQVLSPVLDIARDARWGRVEETFGEDPFLIAENATAFISGYQSNGVACTPKHFIAHGSPTGGLNCSSVSGGERQLRSLYLYPFRRVITETSPLSLMSCYSSYDGVAVTGSRYYMTDLLRGELGFEGYTYADWGAVERLENYHHCVSTNDEAALLAVKAGIDLNVMGAYGNLVQLVKDGVLDERLIDEDVRRILRVKFQLGLFDGSGSNAAPTARSASHLALAKEIADQSAVLMENNGILPLDTSNYRRIALVGPNSNQTVFGDYSWADAFTLEGVTLLQGLRERLPAGCQVQQADGCDWWSRDESHIAEAVALARRSDVVIAAVGSRSTFLARKSLYNTAGEGNDLCCLDLPGVQNQLLEALKATGKPLVVVLVTGRPFAMPWVKENADAFVLQWYGGEMQGASLADILLGNVNPSGKLNISFPRSTGNNPCYYNYLPGDREYYGGHGGSFDQPAERYVFEKPYALWNFGHGLSYTNFDYRAVRLDRHEFTSTQDTLHIEVDVANTGRMEGKEVVQVYIHDKVASVAVPVQQLKAFRKVSIPAGETVTVRMELPISELALYNEKMQCVVEPGEFEILVGSASDDIHFTETITYR
ncbi:MAG: glycoside hydrolase family 3 C-terminal domain-containing protein, partial [Bacteroidales bacterium]|nr:glycoside hydrolase family 3 C-terminal domain-containing protein [Bacteroidales bacterium]